MTDDKMELPSSWSSATLDEFTQARGQSLDPAKFPDEEFDLYSVPAFECGAPDVVSGSDIGSSKQLTGPNKVLLCKINPRINRVWVVSDKGPRRQIASTEWIQFSETECLDPEYLCYYLCKDSVRNFLSRNASGVGGSLMRVKPSTLKGYPVPIAPLNEQHRIVEKIETLFARIDKGEEALREVQKLLKRYRQSILKAAVTGKLTRDWREANQQKLEPASDLLARTLESRRKNWQGRGKYKEPLEPDSGKFSLLPEGWVWATIDQLSAKVEYGSSAKCSPEDLGVPVLRMGNIVNGAISYDNLKYLPEDHSDFPKLLLEGGDLLFNRTNSAELVGKTAVARHLLNQCSFASYLIRVKLIDVVPELIAAYINSVFGRQWIKSVVSQQVGQANVNGSKLKALSVPLPPQKEQEEIAVRLATNELMLLQLQEASKSELLRSDALRQSILKSAFTGQLIPQGPNDEPASELLARIRGERVATSKNRSKKKAVRKSRARS